MKILIISRCFPPDTSIGGVRPFMFAKYLMRFGHNVTVLNSGLIFAKEDNSYYEQLQRMRIISVYKRKPSLQKPAQAQKKKVLPKFLQSLYMSLREPAIILREKKCFNDLFKEYKFIIDKLKGENFDIVFSTYSPIADIYAGEYASKVFKCKWIMDFRDALVQPNTRSWLWNACYTNTQRHAVRMSDVCTTVSNGVGSMLSEGIKHANVVTLYNGYDAKDYETVVETENSLSFCYTGNIYGERMEALRMLFKAIRILSDSGQIALKNICFNYAGSQKQELLSVMNQYGLEATLRDHGYLTVLDSEILQRQSDIFVVLSWNHRKERGILTGKFFEGVRAGKPMLVAVVGEEPNSELAELNKEYRYGFCFEESSSEPMMEELCDWIKKKYDEKMSSGSIFYKQDVRLTEKFKYENLTKELETLCYTILSK